MSQTLPRRGIEDSMYPKPTEAFCLPFDVPAYCSPREGVRLSRATITVAVDFDPQVVSRDEVALGVARRVLQPECKAERFAWQGVRTHAWGLALGTFKINDES